MNYQCVVGLAIFGMQVGAILPGIGFVWLITWFPLKMEDMME